MALNFLMLSHSLGTSHSITSRGDHVKLASFFIDNLDESFVTVGIIFVIRG
jgi:hypothetical protein